ncbi:hypothetical protein ACMFMG_010819 [Clarireedia jacksonii]
MSIASKVYTIQPTKPTYPAFNLCFQGNRGFFTRITLDSCLSKVVRVHNPTNLKPSIGFDQNPINKAGRLSVGRRRLALLLCHFSCEVNYCVNGVGGGINNQNSRRDKAILTNCQTNVVIHTQLSPLDIAHFENGLGRAQLRHNAWNPPGGMTEGASLFLPNYYSVMSSFYF